MKRKGGAESVGKMLGNSRIAVQTARAADVDDTPRLAVLNAEVRGSGPDELEGCRAVQGDNGVPLLVCHLVDDTIPCEARIVDLYISNFQRTLANNSLPCSRAFSVLCRAYTLLCVSSHSQTPPPSSPAHRSISGPACLLERRRLGRLLHGWLWRPIRPLLENTKQEVISNRTLFRHKHITLIQSFFDNSNFPRLFHPCSRTALPEEDKQVYISSKQQ